ncbi:MAG: 3-phosphoshikimate 1-carboxyvinyltransferase [Clostridiales bacterium]|nr:3-phosphoshikimate 1-carboxyvinyltransferase [Clostridiales bacterium]
MNITLSKKEINGRLAAIPSKSMAHRLLICAALSNAPTEIECHGTSADIKATINCLRALGTTIEQQKQRIYVAPAKTKMDKVSCDCGESGSTLRFILPILGALGKESLLTMHGRLPSRPMTPLTDALSQHGCTFSSPGTNPLSMSGQLTAGHYQMPGHVSSQYISGLLFALPLLADDSEIALTSPLQSAPYVAMTLCALAQFGIHPAYNTPPVMDGQNIKIPGRQTYRSPGKVYVEGDWSNAAFMLCAGALGGRVTLTGLSLQSLQGDQKIIELLTRFGAQVEIEKNQITVKKAPLRAIEIDAADIPDLVPILAVTAAGAKGTTVIYHIERLRLKESDRVQTVQELLTRLGAVVNVKEDAIEIAGTGALHGGTVDAYGDHRIAMSAAVASLLCQTPVSLSGAQAVEKSYPTFFEDFNQL